MEYDVLMADGEAAVNAGKPITEEVLHGAGLVRGSRFDGVRLLATGEIKQAVSITVSGASAKAIEAVKAAGGSVTTTVAKPEPAADAKS